MTFWEYLEHGLKACLFDKKAVQDIITEPEHKKHSLILTVVISAIASIVITAAILLLSYFAPKLPVLEFSAALIILVLLGIFVAAIILTLISVGLTHLLARMLGGKASVFQYFNAWMATNVWLGIASGVIAPIEAIPFVGAILVIAFSVYSIVVSVFVIRETYGLSTNRAVAVLAILVAIAIAVALVLAIIILVPIITKLHLTTQLI